MSILSKIISMFTGSASSAEPSQSATASQTHGDCTIIAAPLREGNQYRLAGRIEKSVDGEVLVREFIRADVFSSNDDAVEFTFRKAQQIIDQNGASLFSDGAVSRTV